jgi:uncharacterized protein
MQESFSPPHSINQLKIANILQDLKMQLQALYGDRLVQIILFGSQARGEAESGSDIDVLVVLESLNNPGEEISRTGHITAQLSLQYNEVISCLFMDETRFNTHNGGLLRNIRREGIPV